MKILRIGTMGALLSLLFGCAVGPRYRAPNPALPETWSEAGEEGNLPVSRDISRWWATFNDPVLDSLVERAIRSNPDLRVAEARIREARAARGVVAADRLPLIGASASYTRSERSEGAPPFRSRAPAGDAAGNVFGDRVQNLFQAGFDAGWEIDVFGRVRREVEAASAETDAAVEERRGVLVTLLAEVARNYVELRGGQLRRTILESNLKAERESMDLTKVRFAAGLADGLDVARAEARVSATQAQLPLFETSIKQAIHRIGVLLGEFPGALLPELTKEAPIPVHSPGVPAGLPADLLRRRPDIRHAERELAAATARIGVATADLYPRFSLAGAIGGGSDVFEDVASGTGRFRGFGPGIRWPIFAGGAIRANIRVQGARQAQALALYEKRVLASMEEVENALVAYSDLQKRRRLLAMSEEADRRAVELANASYSAGLEDFIAVLDAQRSLYVSQDRLARCKQDVEVAVIGLYKALGGGWESESRIFTIKESG